MDLLSGLCLDMGVMGISQSAAQNKISTSNVRILRRSSRSSSSYVALKVQQEDVLQKKDGQSIPRRRQKPKFRSAARLKKERPLSKHPIHCVKRPGWGAGRNAGAGPKALTQTAAPLLSEDCSRTSRKNPPTLHACRCITGSTGEKETPPAVNALLSLARQSVQMQTDAMGRRPCVMDVILDLQDRVRGAVLPEARVAAYAVAAVRCNYGCCGGDDALSQYNAAPASAPPPSCPAQGTYNFGDQTSLTLYWADQAARWADIQPIDGGPNNGLPMVGFPESVERSTVQMKGIISLDGLANSGGGDCEL